jgi:hypothetical protein
MKRSWLAYWIATLPSILPTAKPELALPEKHVTTRVCHFNGDWIDCSSPVSRENDTHQRVLCVLTLKTVLGLERLKIWICLSAVPTTISGNETSIV